MELREIVATWVLAWVASLIGFAARISWLLYGVADHPPEDPLALKQWLRKRWWLVVSEFAALPMFASTAVGLAIWRPELLVLLVLGSMFAGALGFAFFLHALETVTRRRLGLGAHHGK